MKTLRHLFYRPLGRTTFYTMMLPLLFGAFLYNVNSLKHASESTAQPVDELTVTMEEGFTNLTYDTQNEEGIVWQMHAGQGLGKFIPGPGDPTVREILTKLYGPASPQHGDPGGYAYADIPPADDAGWMEAPVDPEDGQLCFRLDRSTIEGNMTELDFTYFQTTITVSDTTLPFIVEYLQVDDGVRAYVFNERYPEGTFLPDGPDADKVPDGDARLYQTPASADLTSLLVPGENRIVLVQFDNASTQNYLKVVANYDGGEIDPCANDVTGPQIFLVSVLNDTIFLQEDSTLIEVCSIAEGFNVGAVDECDPSVSAFFDIIFDGNFPDGRLRRDVILNATDASGNTTTKNISIATGDVEPPLMDLSAIVLDTLDCVSPEELPEPTQILATDNCDPSPLVETAVLITAVNDTMVILIDDGENTRTIITELGTQVDWVYTATDASGNTTVDTVAAYFINKDNERPEITSSVAIDTFGSLLINDIVNVCNTYPISEESLGLSATDNCTEDLQMTILLLDEDFQPIDSVDGPGTYFAQVSTTDEAGNIEIINIILELEANPDILTVTAGDDSFAATAGQTFTFAVSDLINNDAASNGADLEVQDVALLNSADGDLNDNGDGSYTFTPSNGFSGDVQLTYVVKSADESLYFSTTGNFYEFVSAPRISWEDAKVAAEAKILNGINGYLATITSQAENDFIFSRLEGNGWIGASDAEEEGVWKWVTGPEAGQQFWQGSWASAGGAPVAGAYSNWDNSGSFLEPNNINNEDYAHLAGEGENGAEATPGTWNDFPNQASAIRGYVVEYGGVDGCIPPGFTATGNITINYPIGFISTEESETVTATVTPNPLLNSGIISVFVPENGEVTIEIRDLNGQLVKTANYDAFKGVKNDFELQRGNLLSGVYFITVKTATERKTIRAIITE